MERKLVVTKQGDFFHLDFKDFQGPYEGHNIAKRLGLAEQKPPAEGESGDGLKPGQCYLVHAMSRHPDLHALVGAEQLEAVAGLVQQMHVVVVEGKELLPEAAEPPPPVHDAGQDSYIKYIEERHLSAAERGKGAVVRSVVAWVLVVTVLAAGVTIAARHLGDHYILLSTDDIFTNAAQPFKEQTAMQHFLAPDWSHLAKMEFRGVKFLDGNRLIFADGNFLRVDGVSQLRPFFDLCEREKSTPLLRAQVGNGTVHIDKMMCGQQVWARDATLVRIARLEPGSQTPPLRGTSPAENVFLVVQDLRHDDNQALAGLANERISVAGRIKLEGERRVLRQDNGAGFVLLTTTAGAPMERFIDAFTDDPSTVQLDMVVSTVYPWFEKTQPDRSRFETKLIGEGDVYSASAQNFNLIVRK